MKFLSSIENNSIILTTNNIRKKILKYIDDNSLLVNAKYMTFKELFDNYYFTYDEETLSYIINKYKIDISTIKEILKFMYYDYDIKDDKINFINDLKKELFSKGLLYKNDRFINFLKSKSKLYVYGFDSISKEEDYLLLKIKDLIDIEYIEKEYKEHDQNFYELSSLTDEIAFVAEQISKLISSGIDVNNIYISGYKEDYYYTYKTIFNMYNININLDNDNLFSTSLGLYFINNIDKNINELLEEISIKFDINNNIDNLNIYNCLIGVINKFNFTDNLIDNKDLLIYTMKNTKINKPIKSSITITDILDNSFDENDYVFLTGFNLGSIPVIKNDIDYINDKLKPDFIENSNDYNKRIKQAYIKVLKSIDNLVITYNRSDSFKSNEPSFLIEYFTKEKIEFNYSLFCDKYNKYKLTSYIDDLIKYGSYNKDLSLLYNSYNVDYNTYDNSYKKIDEKKIKDKINDNITFSYSNISTYYKCPFRFYISNILKINEFEDTFEKLIGNLFHYTLEKALEDKNSDIDKIYYDYINSLNISLTNKDKFFINKLNKEIHYIIETIRKQYSYSLYDTVYNEKRIELELIRNIKTKVKGFIDKILLHNNEVVIIDYKTDNTIIDKDLIEFGLSLQLPIYLYLLNKFDKNLEVEGMYFQHLLSFSDKYEIGKDKELEKEKSLKLDGITIDDINLIKNFDSTYENSEVIKSLKLKQDGSFMYKNRIFTKEEREKMISLVEELIYNVIDNVSSSHFNIAPIKIDKKVNGCDYCSYKDICFRKSSDYIIKEIKRKEEEENGSND